MKVFSTSELSKKSGTIIAEAMRRPVTITQRGHARLVVLSMEDYQILLSRGQDTRTAKLVKNMPEELQAELLEAIDRFNSVEDDDAG